jgi:hypothetical protein
LAPRYDERCNDDGTLQVQPSQCKKFGVTRAAPEQPPNSRAEGVSTAHAKSTTFAYCRRLMICTKFAAGKLWSLEKITGLVSVFSLCLLFWAQNHSFYIFFCLSPIPLAQQLFYFMHLFYQQHQIDQ